MRGLPLGPPPQHIQDPLKFIIRFIFLFPPLDLSPWQQFSQLHFISFSANLFFFPASQFNLSFLILYWSALLRVQGAPLTISQLFQVPLVFPRVDLFLGPHSHLCLLRSKAVATAEVCW